MYQKLYRSLICLRIVLLARANIVLLPRFVMITTLFQQLFISKFTYLKKIGEELYYCLSLLSACCISSENDDIHQCYQTRIFLSCWK